MEQNEKNAIEQRDKLNKRLRKEQAQQAKTEEGEISTPKSRAKKKKEVVRGDEGGTLSQE